MNKTLSFKQELEENGFLLYTNKGRSMEPLIKEGRDVLLIRKVDSRLNKYDIALYKRENGSYVLHRIMKVNDEDYVLCGDNQYKREYGIKDRQILGKLDLIIRGDRQIKLEGFSYRLYLFFFCDLFYIRCFLLYLRQLFLKVNKK